MVIENNPFIFDPAMGAEGGETDAEFPVCRDAEQAEISQEQKAPEQAGFMPCKQIGRETMKGSCMINRFLELIGAAGQGCLPAACGRDHVAEGSQTGQGQTGQEGAQKRHRPDFCVPHHSISRTDRGWTDRRPAGRRPGPDLPQKVHPDEPACRQAQILRQRRNPLVLIERSEGFGVVSGQAEIPVLINVEKDEGGADGAGMQLWTQSVIMSGGGLLGRATG